ncbi:MAG: hypothetical protein AAF602_13950 [Myxococcota bacterium]
MKADLRILASVLAAGALAGCDYSGDWLFSQPVPGLPPVYNITQPDGSSLVPAVVTSPEEVAEATIYGEVAASQTTELGGVTAEFVGTGGSVCIWVDPEVMYWTQAVAGGNIGAGANFQYPDNVWDDGDLDLRVGLSVYYTGSPDSIGDFLVSYEDDLGNPVEVELQDCPNQEVTPLFADFVDGGSGAPERCTIDRTEPGVSYTIVLRTWSTPIDDDRLSYGLLVAEGPCSGANSVESAAGRFNQNQATDENVSNAECVIATEAIRPYDLGDDEDAYQPFFGLSALVESGNTFPNLAELEDIYCRQADLREFCRPEARQVRDAGEACLWDGFEDDEPNPLPKRKCFCGDPNDTPINGPG